MIRQQVTITLTTDVRGETRDDCETEAQRLLERVRVPGRVDDWDAEVSVSDDDGADAAFDAISNR